MALVLRAPFAGSADLPQIGDYGFISGKNLLGLYNINSGDGLADSSGNGNTLSLAYGAIPSYSNGVLQFRANSVTAQSLNTGIQISGVEETRIIALQRKVETGASSVYSGNRDKILSSDDGTMTLWGQSLTINANWGPQSKRPQITTASTVDKWFVWYAMRDANGVSISLNGQTPITVAYDTVDVDDNLPNPICIGDAMSSSFRPLEADVAFFAVYDRKFSALDLTSTQKAISRQLLSKGIVVS